MGQRVPSGEEGPFAPGRLPLPRDAFARQVRDALVHLHDLLRLQTSPLARQVPPDRRAEGPDAPSGVGAPGTSSAGKALQRRLLSALAALRPERDAARSAAGAASRSGSPARPVPSGGAATGATSAAVGIGRGHQLLTLRYVDGLSIEDVCARFAISQSQYFREHRRGLDALVSLLWEQWEPRGRSGGAPSAVPPPPPQPPETAGAGGWRAGALPAPLDRFVGRDAAVAALERLLERSRLVTLTGPGGIGKTRLALEVANRVRRRFRAGGAFVPLDALTDSRLVADAVATALGAPQEGGRPALERLTAFVRDRQLLVLLDNFEHVLGAASLVTELLRACPHVTALVTSRAALRLTGEQEFAVPPLTLPGPADPSPTDPDHPRSQERGAQSEAVALFVERARAVAADFALTDEHAPAVAAICRRLDGLPLAIELAAAQTRLLPPRALVARLDGPSGDTALRLLAGGPRDAAARQRTLRDTIAWSYDLLPPAPQTVFRRLGVFAGGCTLEAAEAVAAGTDPGLDAPTVLAAVGALVSSSLVRRDELPDGGVRLVLLRTIREFALEALASCGEAPATGGAHAAYVLALAEQAAPHVQGAAQSLWVRRLETEHDNARAALRWLADAGEAERGLRLGNALLWFWFNRGHWREGHAWLERFLEAADDRPPGGAPGASGAPGETGAGDAGAQLLRQRARALFGAGWLAAWPGDHAVARARYAACLAAAARAGDRQTMGWARYGLGTLAAFDGAYAAAGTAYRASLALFRETDDRWGTNLALCWLGNAAGVQGHDRTARGYYEAALQEARQTGNRIGVARGLLGLGDLAWHAGQYARSRRLLEESLAIRHEVGDRQATAWVLTRLGRTCRDLGDLAAARAWLEQGLALIRELEGGQASAAHAHQLYLLGDVARRRGEGQRAAALYAGGLELYGQLGDPLGTALCLVGLAALAVEATPPQAGRAARLSAVAAVLQGTPAAGKQHAPRDVRAEYVRAAGAVRAALDGDACAQTWVRESRALAPAQAMRWAMEQCRP
jgi:predicted ATPase